MRVEDFDYELPEELIAQKPLKHRDSCRLMVLDKADEISHRSFSDVLEYLNPGDCLVLNDSRVIPARLFGTKESTGARIEFLLLKRIQKESYHSVDEAIFSDDGCEIWETMVRPGRRLRRGDKVIFSDITGKSLSAEIIGEGKDGTRIVRFQFDGIFMERLEEIGLMPLPPYIDRPATEEDRDDYQTVYNKYEGSVAAPTAGLHFTKELLRAAEEKGVKLAYLTLHVGIGTFRPVKVDKVEEHHMHFEEYTIPKESAETINETMNRGGRIISVGTTSTRTLESAAVEDLDSLIDYKDSQLSAQKMYRIVPGSGSTDIFIYPGYEFKIVDGLITNFHLPKSTLIMLVSALAGKERVMEAYKLAVKEKYRFFSYGDAMLII